MCGFTPSVFLNKICSPILSLVEQPRIRNGASNCRRNKVETLDRILRFILRLRGVPPHELSQSPATISRDFRHIGLCILEGLSTHIQPLEPGSNKYNNLKSKCVFSPFKNVVYAMDVTKVLYHIIYI